MHRPLRPFALASTAAVLIGIIENVFFGRDTPGTAHNISVGFFFLIVAGVVALLVTGAVALTRRVRGGHDGPPVASTSR